MSWTRLAVCSSLSLFSTSSRATAVLSAAWRACSDSRICARASSSWPLAASAKIRSAASQNCASERREVLALLGRPPRHGNLRFAPERALEIDADAIELRGPRGQRIRLIAVEHVAHRQAERVEIVLDAEQLERVRAVAIGEVGLQLAQARNLARRVPRHATTASKGHARPSSSAGVGDRPSAARLAPITTPASGVPSTARQCNRWWAVRRRARGAASRSGRGGNGCAWRPA